MISITIKLRLVQMINNKNENLNVCNDLFIYIIYT